MLGRLNFSPARRAAAIADRYRIGGIYWAPNPNVGPKAICSGVLEGWAEDGRAVLRNRRLGEFHATLDALKKHN